MSDKIIMENYLLVLKSTVEVYIHGTLESSNKEVRNLMKSSLDDTLSSQADTYDLMSEYGYYNIENATSSTVKKKLNSIKAKC